MPNEEALRLLAAHGRGALTDAQRAQLADYLLADQDLFGAFAEEQLLSEALEDKTFRRSVMAALAQRNGWGKAFRLRWIGYMPRGWALGAATLGLLAVSVGAVLFLIGRGTKTQMAGLKLPEIRESGNSQSPKPTNAAEAPRGTPVVPDSSDHVLAILLAPSVRSAGVGNTIRLTRAAKRIRLQADVGMNDFAEYVIEIQTAEGRPIREWTGIMPGRSPGDKGRRVSIEAPSSVLPAGDYILNLFGVEPDGKKELVDGFSFHVVSEQ
jgi:hypothetical protein